MNGENYDWFAAQIEATDDTETGELTARDNEAYRRDFPELEYNRWTDDGGRVVDVQTYGGEPRTIRIPAPNTLGQLLDANLDLTAEVPEDAYVLSRRGTNDAVQLWIVIMKGNK